MPKRLVDGDALWRSDKLAQVQPPSFRAEYANLLPLAEADGTFEASPLRVWADVYAYNRPDINAETVEKILNEFERVGMLVRRQNGTLWGYWIGIESRLPPRSHRNRFKQGAGELFKDVEEEVQSESGGDQEHIRAGLVRLGKENHIDAPDERQAALDRVWGYYVTKLGKNPKLLTFTTERRKKGLSRLNEMLVKTLGDVAKAEKALTLAVDALAASAFHCGENQQKRRYDSWEKNLFKSQEQLEEWLGRL